MEKHIGCGNNNAAHCLNKNENLLARFLTFLYVIPPVVKQTSVVCRRSLVKRHQLPLSRGQRVSQRAGNRNDHEIQHAEMEPVLSERAGSDEEAKEMEMHTGDDDCDPARAHILGSGPGGNRSFASTLISNGTFKSFPAYLKQTTCHCNCDCCDPWRKYSRQWCVPRIIPAHASTGEFSTPRETERPGETLLSPSGARNQTGASKPCVLGVLSCGYVLSGSGRVKTLARKRA